MKKSLLLCCCLLLGITNAMAQDADETWVYCLVLDKTMSMTGHGGTDIWDDVQNYCYEWTKGVAQSSTVLLYTYDKDLYGPQVFSINSDEDREKVNNAIKNVKVDGRFTYIASNLRKVVDYIYKEYPATTFKKRIYLITDGIEEEQNSNFEEDVLKAYGSWRGDYDHLFYVDLRDMADDITKHAIENTNGVSRGKGFVKFVTISPVFGNVNYIIGESVEVEQHFSVTDDNVFSGLSFDLKVDNANIKVIGEQSKQPNVLLSLSGSISNQSMEKIDIGTYKLKFSVNFINNSECECDIPVTIVCKNAADKEMTAQPNVFYIKARNKKKPVVRVKIKGFEN